MYRSESPEVRRYSSIETSAPPFSRPALVAVPGSVLAPGPPVHERAGVEDAEVERVLVEVTPGDRVRGEVHLEAPVEQEPILLVRAHAAADAVRRLEEDDLGATPVQHLCAREAGETGPDNDNFHNRKSVAQESRITVKASTPCTCAVSSLLPHASGYMPPLPFITGVHHHGRRRLRFPGDR